MDDDEDEESDCGEDDDEDEDNDHDDVNKHQDQDHMITHRVFASDGEVSVGGGRMVDWHCASLNLVTPFCQYYHDYHDHYQKLLS